MTTPQPALISNESNLPQPDVQTARAGFFANLNIGLKLRIAFGILIGLTLLLGIGSLVATNRRNTALETLRAAENQMLLAQRIQVEILQARRLDQAFLQNYAREGFEAARQNYVVPNLYQMQAVLDLLERKRQLKTAGDETGPALNQYLANLDEVERQIRAYQHNFSQLVSNVEARGVGDTGLEGRFLYYIHALQDSPMLAGQPDLKALLLQMRQHEKDWALRANPDDVEQVNRYGDEMRARIRDLSLLVEEKANLLILVDTYLANFNTAVELDRKIAAQAGEVDVTTQYAASLLRQIIAQEELISNKALDEFQQVEAVAQTVNLVLLAVIIAAGGGMALVITRSIAGPIVRLTDMARQVTAGNLELQAEVGTRDEIGRLALAFNVMTARLREVITSLEAQVQARTAELVLSMEVGQQASAIRELDELLPTITGFIRERFNLYYVHLYFVDDTGENLVIKAGTGEVGRQLMARRHSLPVGIGSIVGQVAVTGESIVVPDTETSDIHKPNPLLPLTRSELAVPLKIGRQVIGVLDMQADRPNTFTEANLTVFEAMAAQLSNAIDSARQWEQSQTARQQAEAALRQMTREGWAERLGRQKQGYAFMYDLSAVTSLSGGNGHPPPASGPAAPLVVQNQAIGRIIVKPPDGRVWTEEEQALLAAVAQQLAQKAENLRLFEQTQEYATREQLTRQITDKMRTAPDVDSIINTGLTELARALGVPRAYVKLRGVLKQTPAQTEPEAGRPISADGGPAAQAEQAGSPAEFEESA